MTPPCKRKLKAKVKKRDYSRIVFTAIGVGNGEF